MEFRNRKKKRQQRHLKTGFESLESRVVMDGTFGLVTAAEQLAYRIPIDSPAVFDQTCETSIDNNNVLTIKGGMAKDHVTVTEYRATSLVKVNVKCGNGVQTPWIFPQGTLNKIVFYGGSGNDTFGNYSLVPSEAYGEGGNDTLLGGPGADEFHGGIGSDFVKGNVTWEQTMAVDKLFGGAHDDFIEGGAGDDLISGGSGNDTLDGGPGNDQLYGGSGMDSLFGGFGDDYLQGGDDNQVDHMNGGPGIDTFVNQWRKKTRNGNWILKESELVGDYAIGETLEWKESSSPRFVHSIPWLQ